MSRLTSRSKRGRSHSRELSQKGGGEGEKNKTMEDGGESQQEGWWERSACFYVPESCKNDNLPRENLEMHMPEVEFGHFTEFNNFLAEKLLMVSKLLLDIYFLCSSSPITTAPKQPTVLPSPTKGWEKFSGLFCTS